MPTDREVGVLMRELLASRGDPSWVIQMTTDASRGLELAGATPQDVVLLSVPLVNASAAEVYRQIRTRQPGHHPRIVLVSALSNYELTRLGITDGVLMRMPFDAADLVALVDALLRG